MVQMFNLAYFLVIAVEILIIIGLHFLLRNKSQKTKKLVLFILLLSNLALHFIKVLFPPYSLSPETEYQHLWLLNLCATSVIFFPFAFISKSESAKDYVVYLGCISGFLSMFYPTEALGHNVFEFDVLRFYYCHFIIFAVPVLMLSLKTHKLSYKRIWKTPFYICLMLIIIVFNQVVASEMGFLPIRDGNFNEINFHNPSLIWGPTDDVAVMFSWATPNFMKTIPIGNYAGTEKWWPFFWMVPSVFIYFILIPLIFCVFFDKKELFGDVKKLFAFIKTKFTKTK